MLSYFPSCCAVPIAKTSMKIKTIAVKLNAIIVFAMRKKQNKNYNI